VDGDFSPRAIQLQIELLIFSHLPSCFTTFKSQAGDYAALDTPRPAVSSRFGEKSSNQIE
jgi:hypothetical protein